jgi:large subunit ribosomal protein L32
MAVPKRKTSKSKRNKRRSHHALSMPTLRRDPETDELHLSHRAHMAEDGAYYYRGRRITEPTN